MKTEAVISVDGTKKGSIRVPVIDEAIASYRAYSNYRGQIGDNVFVKPSSLPPPPAEMVAHECDADDEMPPAPVEDSGCDSDAGPVDVAPIDKDCADMYPEATKCECGGDCATGMTECPECIIEIAKQAALEAAPRKKKTTTQWGAPLTKSAINDLLA